MKKSLLVFLILVVAVSAIVACGVEAQVTTTTTTTENITPEPPVHEHTVVVDEPVAATCTSTGLSAGASCSECGEIFVAQQEVPMIPHDEEIIPAVESSCMVAGLTEGKKCSVCGEILIAQAEAPLKAHAEEIVPAVDATCTTTGLTAGVICTVCGKMTIEQQEIPTLPHTYDDKYDESCNDCGFIRDAECPHREVETIPGYNASCTSTGLSNGSQCKKCGEILLAQQVLPIKGHSEVVIEGYDSTCTNIGLTNGIRCTECQNILVAQEIIPTKPHTNVLDEAVASTCTSTGLTDGAHCGVCGAITRAQEVVDLIPHTESDWIIDTGTQTQYKKCLVCGEILETADIVIDTSNFDFQPANNNLTIIGNENEIFLSDLFKLRNGAEIPEGAELVVFNQVFSGDTHSSPSRTELQQTDASTIGLSVDSVRTSLADSNFNSISIKFSGTSNDAIYIAVMQNGARISEDVVVKVVDGINVRTYADLTSNINAESTAYHLTSNVVFLDNITMSGDVNFLQIPADKTLYGNGFKFDITKGRLKEEGIINLKGTLRDVMVVGAVYSTFSFSAGDDYGSSAVNATGNAYIYNSYIANTRSPLRTSGAGVVIEDSVLFGGRYSNIDMTGGTITIKGTVTTVQQVYSDKNVIGMGVSAWFNDGKKNVVIEEGANLVQYNFMDESIIQYLPQLKVANIFEVMDLKEPFNAMFGDTETYGQYMYTAANGKTYANFGIVSTDKYMLDYTVTGDPSSSSIISGKTYKVGAIKTVKIETSVSDTEVFTIVYDTRFTPKVGTVASAGKVEVTGAQLKAGVQFEVNEQMKFGTLTGDGTSYMLQIQSDDYLTINVSGAGSTYEYNQTTYNFDTDLGSTLGNVESILSMHDRGIHYGKMSMGVYTPNQEAYAYGTTTYQQLLEQYIEMTDGDGEGDNFYTPENFMFVNGQISNYWD